MQGTFQAAKDALQTETQLVHPWTQGRARPHGGHLSLTTCMGAAFLQQTRLWAAGELLGFFLKKLKLAQTC